MTRGVEVARYLARGISRRPEGVRVEHVWTPSADLVFLRLPAEDKKRLRAEEVAALLRVIELLGREEERELVVDLK